MVCVSNTWCFSVRSNYEAGGCCEQSDDNYHNAQLRVALKHGVDNLCGLRLTSGRCGCSRIKRKCALGIMPLGRRPSVHPMHFGICALNLQVWVFAYTVCIL